MNQANVDRIIESTLGIDQAVAASSPSSAAAAAPVVLHVSESDRAAWAALQEWAKASHELIELAGGCDDQAEELAADLMVALAGRDEELVEVRAELEQARARVAMLERIVERRGRYIAQFSQAIRRVRDELELERAARELAERLARKRADEIHRLERENAELRAELDRARRGFRETYSREGAS